MVPHEALVIPFMKKVAADCYVKTATHVLFPTAF
jgi:hypothetical protein